MSYTQQYLPIYNPETKIIMGMFNLGANVDFVGDEETYDLGDAEVAVQLVTPTPSLIRKVNPAYMAAVFTREEFRLMQHRCSSKFTEVNDNLPAYGNRSTGALNNIRDNYDGAIVAGLAESFGVGLANLVPQISVAPLISGTATEGETLTTTNGTWTNSPVSYTRKWFRNGLEIAGQTGLTYVLTLADVGALITTYVTATNARGTNGAASSNSKGPIVGL
jgi:hypothetical protein